MSRQKKGGSLAAERQAVLWSRPGFLVRRLHQIHVAMFIEECAEARLTPIQCGIMTVAASTPGLGYSAIAEQLGFDRSNVASVLRRLIARGWVIQRTGGADRRKKRIWLSASGKKLLTDFESRIQRSQDRLLVPLNKAQRKVFMAMIHSVVNHNNEVSRAPLRMPDDDY